MDEGNDRGTAQGDQTDALPAGDGAGRGELNTRYAKTAFLERAIDLYGVPEKITLDKSGANTAAIQSIQADCGADIELRQNKYLNNIVEQDHRAIKRIVRPMLGFKSFRCARILICRH